MAVSALMSGDVELYLGTSGEMMNAGTDKVKRLAVAGASGFRNCRICRQLPKRCRIRVAGWNGMFAPAGTPPEIVNLLARGSPIWPVNRRWRRN